MVGARLGIGCFNLVSRPSVITGYHDNLYYHAPQIISLLPQRILKLLEFVGFSGNRETGLQELTKGARSSTLHSTMCSSFLLFYHTVASIILGEWAWFVGYRADIHVCKCAFTDHLFSYWLYTRSNVVCRQIAHYDISSPWQSIALGPTYAFDTCILSHHCLRELYDIFSSWW